METLAPVPLSNQMHQQYKCPTLSLSLGIYTPSFRLPLLLSVSKDAEDELPGTVSVYSKMNIYFMKDDVL